MPPAEKTAAPIVARNPFDSSQRVPEAPAQRGVSQLSSSPCAAITAHAIIQSNEDGFSFASLQTKDERALARKGSQFAGHEVLFVGRETVWLGDSRGETCRVELAAKEAPVDVRAPARPAAVKPAAKVDPEIARGIRATSATSYDIDRAAFERIMTSTAELMGDVRIGPDKESGRTMGMKLSHLRPGSVLTLVGLKEGDRLDAINGIDLTSPESGLEAFAKLREAPHLVLKVSREGRAMELQYDVR
jgi:general secretion pathway protein C